jgi:hypothetical protein
MLSSHFHKNAINTKQAQTDLPAKAGACTFSRPLAFVLDIIMLLSVGAQGKVLHCWNGCGVLKCVNSYHRCAHHRSEANGKS